MCRDSVTRDTQRNLHLHNSSLYPFLFEERVIES